MLMLIAALFAGSQACRPCHAAIADAYAQTPMARSSGRAAPLPSVNFAAAGHKYRINGNTLSFDSGSAPIDYFILKTAVSRYWWRDDRVYPVSSLGGRTEKLR